MAILRCGVCGNEQGMAEQRPIERDGTGRVIREGPWTFDPNSGCCIADSSNRDGTNAPFKHRCFNFDNCPNARNGRPSMMLYSTQPVPRPVRNPGPTRQAQIDENARNATISWSLRRKPCGCRGGRCQIMCGCAGEGKACSVLCGCGGANEDCLNPHSPSPDDIPPASKKCSCTSGCTIDPNRIGSQCSCAAMSLGCSALCRCAVTCRNPNEQR
ncbi:hypothetical protein C8J56DRAFT_925136 [Mycena floridula]|nr:hypothetical protein C8J56DRAFT_925136 [Mycena floridula]